MEGKKRKKRNFYLLITSFIILTSAFFPLFKTVTGSKIYASFDPYENIPPYQPTNPSPSDGSTNVALSITLKVYVTDPDNDTIEVYFYNAADDSLIGSITTASGYNATVSWSGLQSSNTYRWYAVANDSEYENRSQNWSFITRSSGSGEGYIPPNQEPIADITGSSFGYVNQILLFFANDSYDPDGNIIGYRWDFESDGHWNTEWINDTFCFHTYSQPGNYTVRLQVKDDDGATDLDYHNISIQELLEKKMLPIPVTKVKYEGFVNENITFDSSGSYDPDGNITGFTWYFGDGNISFERNPVHSYADEGYYFVYLKVTDDGNLSNWAIATAFIRNETSNVTGVSEEKDQPFLLFTWLVILLVSIIANMLANGLRKKHHNKNKKKATSKTSKKISEHKNKRKKKPKDKKQGNRQKPVITTDESGKDKPKKLIKEEPSKPTKSDKKSNGQTRKKPKKNKGKIKSSKKQSKKQ